MGLLSPSVSIARYTVEKDENNNSSILEIVRKGLKKNTISEIEDEYAEILTGWTSFENHFDSDFEKHPFQFGTYFVFSFRIDKKSIPQKIIQKYTSIEIIKKLKQTNRDFLSKNEKTDIKDAVIEKLMHRIPSTPNIYDVLWDYDQSNILLFTTQKAANEEFETLFSKSFNFKIIRIFPFTLIEKNPFLTNNEKDKILNLSSIKFSK